MENISRQLKIAWSLNDLNGLFLNSSLIIIIKFTRVIYLGAMFLEL